MYDDLQKQGRHTHAMPVHAAPLREYGAKWTLATLRKCVYPFPVYEAHYAVPRTDVDCEVLRMSFWAPTGKPLAMNTAKRRQAMQRKGFMVLGMVEDKRDGSRFEDTGEAPAKVRYQPKKVLRELLAYLDGDHDNPKVIDQARELVAA